MITNLLPQLLAKIFPQSCSENDLNMIDKVSLSLSVNTLAHTYAIYIVCMCLYVCMYEYM